MKILIVSATSMEISPFLSKLELDHSVRFQEYQLDKRNIDVLVTGIGLLNTGIQLTKLLSRKVYDLVINVGVAGSYDRTTPLGTLVEVIADRYGDLGVGNGDGSFLDMDDIGLTDPNGGYFDNGWVKNTSFSNNQLEFPLAKSISVQTVTGTDERAIMLHTKYVSDIESMEGMAVAQACNELDQRYLQVRSISNYVEKRDRTKWQMIKAIGNMNEWLTSFVFDVEL